MAVGGYLLLEEIVCNALREDIGSGDATTSAVIPSSRMARALIVAKAVGIVAGVRIAEEVFRQIDPELRFESIVEDGDAVEPGDLLCTIQGSARTILTGERVALNFMQRMSGIATLTARYVEAVKGTAARIVDTRKTTPGLRLLEKYAVTVGGGHNHRMGLYDAVLIKDNHIVASGSIAEAVRRARQTVSHTMTITVECETLMQVDEALNAGADILLLDNMNNELRRKSVARSEGKAMTEASGDVTLETVAEIAATGVDIISVGALTHSAPALNISLDMQDDD